MKIQLKPQAFYDLVLQPSFADIQPGATMYPDTLHLFEIVDNVSIANGMTMIDVFQKQNFLKRKDRSCKTVWSTVGTTANRKLTVTELYAATEFCQEEFYAGALSDLRDNPTVFRNLAFDILKRGTRMDMLANCWFGAVDRADDSTKTWNWNSFDGIVQKIAEYIADTTIPGAQVMTALPSGAITPLQAYTALQDAYDRRSELMASLDEMDLSFTIDRLFAEAYQQYLISTGVPSTAGPGLIQNGVPVLAFKGIPIYVEKTWNPILKALNAGTAAHMCILTISGNCVFGTDKSYGGGANLDQAVRLWYSEDDDVWKNKLHMVGGTQLRSPQHVVFGLTTIA
jgi:hypothetical protein